MAPEIAPPPLTGREYGVIVKTMDFMIEFEQEDDGRWIAEIPELPGVMAYGVTRTQAGEKAKALAFRVLADRIESDYSLPNIDHVVADT